MYSVRKLYISIMSIWQSMPTVTFMVVLLLIAGKYACTIRRSEWGNVSPGSRVRILFTANTKRGLVSQSDQSFNQSFSYIMHMAHPEDNTTFVTE